MGRSAEMHFKKYWKLDSNSKVLDVGCAKGFMLYDLMQLIPGIHIKGLDISKYAIENCKEEVREYLTVGNAKNLPFEDNEFDVVISINSIHNLDKQDCGISLREIERVSKKHSFVTVDAYRNEKEKANLLYWQVTCEAFNTPEEWEWWFNLAGYNGDYSLNYFE